MILCKCSHNYHAYKFVPQKSDFHGNTVTEGVKKALTDTKIKTLKSFIESDNGGLHIERYNLAARKLGECVIGWLESKRKSH